MPAPLEKRAAAALAVACALVLTGATCDRNGKTPAPAKPALQAENPATKPAAEEMADPLGAPGMDFSSLDPVAQEQLAQVFSDEFCYCGCPHTLGACLKEHTDCRHAKRMATLAATLASEGAQATEIIVLLSRYYASFRERAQLPVDPRMCVGPSDAKVTLVEFSDYQCPFCAAAAPLLADFAKGQADVRLCHLPFPLKNHPLSLPAAQAARLAAEQGKFWEMHHAIFEHQDELSRERIVELAQKVGLDATAVTRVLDEGTFSEEIAGVRQKGLNAGVDSTPSLFVNGRRFQLGLGQAMLRHTVEDELEWQANKGWAKD